MSGTNNDIDVLDSSPVLHNYLENQVHDLQFEVNGNSHRGYYLLTDSIYPPWAIFVQTLHGAQEQKKAHFAKMQEVAKKDIERCFGVLQIKWGIIQQYNRQWKLAVIKDIMMACIIPHNMIIENERDDGLPPIDYERSDASPTECGLTFAEYREGSRQVRNESGFFSLRNDLIEHHWARKGRNNL